MRFTKQSTAMILGALCLLGFVATTTGTSAQSLERQVIGNGATMIFDSQGNFVFGGTVGQTAVGVSGYEPGSVDLYHGFWYTSKTSSVENPTISTGGEVSLWNAPNPFTSTTTIHFNIPSRSDVRLRVYDMDGQLVRTLVSQTYGQGEHNVTWDAVNDQGEQVATGYYYYTLDAQPTDQGGKAVSYQQKMLLMK
ncbi:MAG: T9SS type A sorting domain-containing protein [Ignavibacteriae bacterium]|nr:T9SS type A sorting domain-containing protein [Ignavibacteriota bacterium]MCB9216602.1 T9SS type A sorting domain-containing protein [Ignavibacteria bacterium]